VGNKMKIVELFAGIGGFRLGFGENNEYVFVNDVNKEASSIYEYQFKDKVDSRFIQDVSSKEIPDHDLLCGGFPCATFSIAGKREGFTENHDKGLLFYEIIRIAEHKKPKFILLENVKGLLTHDNGQTFGKVLFELERIGYDAQWQCINSRYFGTPQNRERVFIVATRKDLGFKNIFPIIGESITVLKTRTYQLYHQKIRTYYGGIFPCLTAYMGTGGNNVPFVLDTDGFRKVSHVECEMLQNLPVNHTKYLADGNTITSAKRYERIGRSLNPTIVNKIFKKLVECYEN